MFEPCLITTVEISRVASPGARPKPRPTPTRNKTCFFRRKSDPKKTGHHKSRRSCRNSLPVIFSFLDHPRLVSNVAFFSTGKTERMRVCVCVRESVCVCAGERENERKQCVVNVASPITKTFIVDFFTSKIFGILFVRTFLSFLMTPSRHLLKFSLALTTHSHVHHKADTCSSYSHTHTATHTFSYTT